MRITEEQQSEEQTQFALRSLAGLGGVLAVGVLFTLVLALVAGRWPVLRTIDVTIVDALNSAVVGRAWVVSVLHFLTDLGGSQAAWLIFSVLVAWLLVRRSPRLATYVAVTGLGAAVLSDGIKALVGRVRPVVEVAVATAPGNSFPSGHALGSTIAYGVLLLVFLPAVPPRFRRAGILGVAAIIAIVGMTRVALGVHYPSDVVAGWLLGILWLAVTGSAFRRWRQHEGLGPARVSAGLAPEDRPALVPAPAHDRPMPQGWLSVSELLVAVVLLWGGVFGAGVLITEVLGPVSPFDAAVVRWFATIHTDELTTAAAIASQLAGTLGVVLVLVVTVPLSLALTRRWRPPLFLLVAVMGETAVFLAVATVVERSRPAVEPRTLGLPPTSSFPSGHVAAAVVTYGAIALLAHAWTRGWLRNLFTAWAVIAPVAVALSRLYRGGHYPTDVIVSIVYGGIWLAVCWHVLRPGRGAPHGEESPDAVADDAVPSGLNSREAETA